jgi:hypothetical protein
MNQSARRSRSPRAVRVVSQAAGPETALAGEPRRAPAGMTVGRDVRRRERLRG